MPLDYVLAAARWFGRHPDQLGASERKALQSAAKNVNQYEINVND